MDPTIQYTLHFRAVGVKHLHTLFEVKVVHISLIMVYSIGHSFRNKVFQKVIITYHHAHYLERLK